MGDQPRAEVREGKRYDVIFAVRVQPAHAQRRAGLFSQYDPKSGAEARALQTLREELFVFFESVSFFHAPECPFMWQTL